MFRLVTMDDEKINELYRYVSGAVSQTIIEHLDRYLNDMTKYTLFYDKHFGGDFFKGISRHIKPSSSVKKICPDSTSDDQIGYEFVLAKMSRMKEKMQNKNKLYTFDVFEEKVLYSICLEDKFTKKTDKNRAEEDQLKEKINRAKTELNEKYKFNTRDANSYAKTMYSPVEMILKKDEEENLVFWDGDYDFFWRGGFIKGIKGLISVAGTNRGYGYQYVRNMFSDIGIAAPLKLLGTEEVNKAVVKMQSDLYNKHMDELLEQFI